MLSSARIALSGTLACLALLTHTATVQAAPIQAAPLSQIAQAAPAPAAPAQPAPAQAIYPAQPGPDGSYAQPPAGYQPTPSPMYQPAPTYPPPVYTQPYVSGRPVRPSRGLMITGISILAGSYLIATSVGVGLLDEDHRDCRQCRDVAPWLFVPVVGPFIGMSQTHNGEWALWFLGMVEVVGTALTVGGIVRYKRTQRAAEMQGFSSWALPGGRTLSLDASTSARMLGPRLKLTF